MVDIIDPKWAELAPSNNSAAPNGYQGSYAPSTIAPTGREQMAAIKRFYVQNNAIYTSGGSANAYTLTYGGAPAKYNEGIKYAFWASHTNTGAATLNINGLGAKAIVRNDGAALTAGQIVNGSVVIVYYDGTIFRLSSPIINNPSLTGNLDVASITTTGSISGAAFNTNGAVVASQSRLMSTVAGSLTSTGHAFQIGTDAAQNLIIDDNKIISRNNGVLGALYIGDGISGLSIAPNNLRFDGGKVWHEANDGAGSTLDADLLDGQQGAFYQEIKNTTGFTGAVMYFAQSTAPVGFLACNGAAVSRATYAALFAAIGTRYGTGDGTTTFNVPDLRGEFIRGLDSGRGVDAGRALGSSQADAFASHAHSVDPPITTTTSDTHYHSIDPPSTTTSSDTHRHSFPTSTNNSGTGPSVEAVSGDTGTSYTSNDTHSHTVNIAAFNSSSDTHNHTVDIAAFNSAASGGVETRPRNVALLACIKT